METLKREPKTLLTEMVSQKVLVSLPVVFTSALLTRCRLYARFYGKGQKNSVYYIPFSVSFQKS